MRHGYAPETRYCNTAELIERDGLLYFHPDRIWITPHPDGTISVDMWKHPEVFQRETGDKKFFFDVGKMFSGKMVLPTFSYDPTIDTFTPQNVRRMSWGEHATRRMTISSDLEAYGSLKIPTEIKKIRRALKVIVAGMPKPVQDDPDVQAFLGLSDFIEDHIALYEKDTLRARALAKWRNGGYKWKEHWQRKVLTGLPNDPGVKDPLDKMERERGEPRGEK